MFNADGERNVVAVVSISTKALPTLEEVDRLLQAHGGSASAALKGEKEEAEEKAAAKEREKREKEKPVPPWTAASDDDKITLSVHDLKLTKAGQAAVNKQVRSLLRLGTTIITSLGMRHGACAGGWHAHGGLGE